MDELKLYVLGELSGDPDEWDGALGRAIVIARNAKEAKSLAKETVGDAIEVIIDGPKCLCFHLEP